MYGRWVFAGSKGQKRGLRLRTHLKTESSTGNEKIHHWYLVRLD